MLPSTTAQSNSKKLAYYINDPDDGPAVILHNPVKGGALRIHLVNPASNSPPTSILRGKDLQTPEVQALMSRLATEGTRLNPSPHPSHDDRAAWLQVVAPLISSIPTQSP